LFLLNTSQDNILQKKKQKLPTRQIYQKYSKSVDKLIVCKFIDGFLRSSIITDRFLIPLIITDEFRINRSIILTTDDSVNNDILPMNKISSIKFYH